MRSWRAGRCGTTLLKHDGDKIQFRAELRPNAWEERPLLQSFTLLHAVLHSPPSLSSSPALFPSDAIHRRGTVTSDLTILPLSPQVQACLSLEHCSPHKHKDTRNLTSLCSLLSRCRRGMEEAEPENLETYHKYRLLHVVSLCTTVKIGVVESHQCPSSPGSIPCAREYSLRSCPLMLRWNHLQYW